MTRAETLAAIKQNVATWDQWKGSTHWDGCVADPRHRDCAIAWLLQEIAYLNTRIEAAADLASGEVERLRSEIARIDAVRIETYLASRKTD